MGNSESHIEKEKLITLNQIFEIAPNFPKKYYEYLLNAMDMAKIINEKRIAAFFSQLCHESGEFKYMQEIASGKAYEGRLDLGNIHPGDGIKFKGRGPIQITGRANYHDFTEWALNKGVKLDDDEINAGFELEFEKHPELLEKPKYGFLASVWFWEKHNLNDLADIDTEESYEKITKIINGGYNGLKDRKKYWNKAKSVLYKK